MNSEIDHILRVVVKSVDFIKSQALKSQIFKILHEDIRSEHTALLFHTEGHWLSRGMVLGRVIELRHEIFRIFVGEKHSDAELFCDPNFLLKLVYLTEIYLMKPNLFEDILTRMHCINEMKNRVKNSTV